MLIDAVPFRELWEVVRKKTFASQAIESVVAFVERHLGAKFLYDIGNLPSADSALADLFEMAEEFKEAGIIKRFGKVIEFPDEPPFISWYAECATRQASTAGGMAIREGRRALTAALAEALERYIWFEMTDYFVSPTRATSKKIIGRGRAIAPERFAGFSEKQRKAHDRLLLKEGIDYVWIKARSHVYGSSVWVPAQIISGFHGIKNARAKEGEPIILETITTGLATGPTEEFALLGGALEIIERDAFMITWLNKLTPPRIDLDELAKQSADLRKLLEMCERYRITVEVIRLPTDAPTYAVCAVARDTSEVGPKVTIGLRAHQNLSRAAEGAILEALRIRRTIRNGQQHGRFDTKKKAGELVHVERAAYWAVGEQYKKLDFLTSGPIDVLRSEKWDNDSDAKHLERIMQWCRNVGYEFVSVDLGASKKNVSPWKIKMVVIPELMPIHQNEKYSYRGGERLKTIPEKLGYVPLATYYDEPHPFA